MDGLASGEGEQNERYAHTANQGAPGEENAAQAQVPPPNIQQNVPQSTYYDYLQPTVGFQFVRSSMVALFGNQEEVTFRSLVPVLMRNMTITAKAYGAMLVSLWPTTEILYYLCRFIMDSGEHIMACTTWKDGLKTGAIFVLEMTFILLFLVFVFGTLLYPIFYVIRILI